MTNSPAPPNTTTPAPGYTAPTSSQGLGFFDDPCATYRKLRDALMSLSSGQTVARTEYHGYGQERHLEFSQPNVSVLRELMDKAFDECQKANGNPNPRRRRAIMAGSRRFC